MLWRWEPGGAAPLISLLFTPEDDLQVGGEEGGAGVPGHHA